MIDQLQQNNISYILDTNVLSELAKLEPNQKVLQKFQSHQHEIALPSIVWHELRFGWLKMPEGKRKHAIGILINEVIGTLAILPYDAIATRIHAEIRLQTQEIGLNIPFVDGQIASTAMSKGLILVTRNTKDFQSIDGLRIENWHE